MRTSSTSGQLPSCQCRRPPEGDLPFISLNTFAERKHVTLLDLVNENPVGALITHTAAGLDANHIPFEVEEELVAGGRLRAHVTRNNPVWREVTDGQQVLVIFRAADAYISPTRYPSKHELHRQVPSWNYRVAHVHGTLCIRDDENFVRSVIARLTRRHEAGTGDARPWKVADSEPDCINQMIAAIVGLQVHITKIEGKFKLSQNKDARDRSNAADQLWQREKIEMARAMWDEQRTASSRLNANVLCDVHLVQGPVRPGISPP
jgi:transcriptional regulator